MAANKGTVFILDWLSHAEWPSLACCAGDIHSVQSVCFKLFWLSNMGKQAVISHASNTGEYVCCAQNTASNSCHFL